MVVKTGTVESISKNGVRSWVLYLENVAPSDEVDKHDMVNISWVTKIISRGTGEVVLKYKGGGNDFNSFTECYFANKSHIVNGLAKHTSQYLAVI